MQQSPPATHKNRLIIIATAIIALWFLALGRLFFIQVVRADDYSQKAQTQQSRKFEIAAERGTIYVKESDGLYPIALNTQVFTLALDPEFVKDKDGVIDTVSRVTAQPPAAVEGKMNTKGRYVEVAKGLSSAQAEEIKKAKLAGVILIPKASRYYPENNLFSHILGYVNDDSEGQYGLEQFKNSELEGSKGRYNTVTDALGVPLNSVENTLEDPKPGKSYVLTIDRGLQAVAADAIKKAVETNRAESGSVVVMDAKTGAIKAMVNYPDYNPNEFRNVKDYNLFRNRSIDSLFEPGSGFKVLTMAAGLNQATVKPTTTYNDTGEVVVSGKSIKNSENHKFGVQTMTDVIQKSLNTGMVFVLQSLGTDRAKITPQSKVTLREYLEKFGFGKVTGIEQAGETTSSIKPVTASDIDYANMSFGQGISVTSMQLVAAVGAIANNGDLMKPYLIEGEVLPDQTVVKNQPVKVRNVVSSQSAKELSSMMVQVVEKGSGYLTRMKGYQIAGKTGTAQVPRSDGKGYEANKNIGSFVGFAPAEDPQFVMVVRVDYPKVSGFAETTAVPAFAIVAKELMNYYQIPPAGI